MHLIEARNLSRAWLAAIRALLAAPGRELNDLIIAIECPLAEEARIRQEAERLPRRWSIETSANTIFPRSYALGAQPPERLAERYASIAPRLRHERENKLGTYLGQLVAYKPTEDAVAVNQLAIAVERSRDKKVLPNVYDMLVAVPGRNTRPMGFPCLTYLNFKLSPERRLLLTAHYRNHYFVARAYGNYLGLARLQQYLAGQMDVEMGAMICVSGHAKLDESIRKVRAMLARLER